MEEALRESEARYQAIVEDQTELVCRFLPDGTLTFVNEAYCRYFNTNRGRMIGSSFKPFLPDQTRQQLEKLWSSLTRENAVATIEHSLVMPDGQVRWQQWINHGIFNEQGQLKEIQAVGRDITKRKRVEEALRESEEKYHSLFENAATATVILEEDMTISMANTECEKLTGYSREEIAGKKKWTEFVVPEDLEKMKKYHYQRREKGGVAPTEYEFRFVDKQGNIKDIFLKIAMIPGTKKSIASLMDITARKQAEEKIRHFPLHLLRVIEEERKSIAQNLHDELGGSLTALRFGLEDLKNSSRECPEMQKIDGLMGLIEKLGENIQKISSDLRPDILDHLGLIPALEWYIRNLNDRIPGLQIDFQPIGFKKRLKPDLEIVLYRIVQEGLTNVAKHAKAKHVHITLTVTHPHIILSIKDDGDGFEEQENLILAAGKKRGIGLWSMRERVASVGGTIHIRSRKGKGTVIRAEMPVDARKTDAEN
jgi:PAS domain S-box-containing protein